MATLFPTYASLQKKYSSGLAAQGNAAQPMPAMPSISTSQPVTPMAVPQAQVAGPSPGFGPMTGPSARAPLRRFRRIASAQPRARPTIGYGPTGKPLTPEEWAAIRARQAQEQQQFQSPMDFFGNPWSSYNETGPVLTETGYAVNPVGNPNYGQPAYRPAIGAGPGSSYRPDAYAGILALQKRYR